MTITYIFAGEKYKLVRGPDGWSGGHPGLVEGDKDLSYFLHHFTGRAEYYPTPWHVAKAIADILGGTLDEPEPKNRSKPEPGVVY